MDGDSGGSGGEGNLSGRVIVLEDGSQEVTEDEALVYRSDGKKIYPCQFCGKASPRTDDDYLSISPTMPKTVRLE